MMNAWKKSMTALLSLTLALGVSTAVFAADTKTVYQNITTSQFGYCEQSIPYSDAEGYFGTLNLIYSNTYTVFKVCYYKGEVTKP
ncbi:hypothetical protein B5M42_000510 [Paenibacillus athensensis]|nr:hypothetical protein [Paenibacillus athensensis]MCD1257317.1 hypothetical protein [Paenibacillus athensensis]